MENLTESKDTKKTFLSHVFSNNEEDKGELFNV